MQDDAYPYNETPFELPHSGPGLASFFISLLAWIAVIAPFGYLVYLAAQQKGGPPPQEQAMVATFVMMGGSGLFIVSAILGLVGVLLPNRKKVFAVLGLVFSLLPVFGCVGLAVIGVAFGSALGKM